MLEAVNSVLSNASATRASAEQQSTVRSYAANPEKVQEAARPAVTRTITIDNSINRAVLEIRDNSSGDVVRQFPTEGQLKAYRTAQQFSNSRDTSSTQSTSPDVGGAETSVAPTSSAGTQTASAPVPTPAPSSGSVTTEA